MNRKELIICDNDYEYCKRFADYLRLNNCNYEISIFSDLNNLIQKQEIIDGVLLINKNLLDSIEDDSQRKQILSLSDRLFLLTDFKNKSYDIDECIYKYQSAKNIINCIGEDIFATHSISSIVNKNLGIRIIGVYSPVSNCLKTTFSLALGQVISDYKSVLYINLEGFSGLQKVLEADNEYSLMDLLYQYSLDSDISTYIHNYIMNIEGVNILPFARNPFELQEVDSTLWLAFINAIINTGLFTTIIIDISDVVREFFEILNICSEIYVPIRTDRISKEKIRHFEESYRKYRNRELEDKIKMIKFPYFSDLNGSLYGLKHSELARYIVNELGMVR